MSTNCASVGVRDASSNRAYAAVGEASSNCELASVGVSDASSNSTYAAVGEASSNCVFIRMRVSTKLMFS